MTRATMKLVMVVSERAAEAMLDGSAISYDLKTCIERFSSSNYSAIATREVFQI